jgi:hypothetical protein
MYLTAPIPGADLVVREITIVSICGQERPVLACVKVHKYGNVGSLAHAASAIASVPKSEVAQRMVVAIWNSRQDSLNVLSDHKQTLPYLPRCSSFFFIPSCLWHHATCPRLVGILQQFILG